tara:strand:- start:248 stop:472 length:225 start_codon:yes stop_codon:yes gene_type:complete
MQLIRAIFGKVLGQVHDGKAPYAKIENSADASTKMHPPLSVDSGWLIKQNSCINTCSRVTLLTVISQIRLILQN